MRKIEDECVGCETCTMGYGCSLRHVIVNYCDVCGDPEAIHHIDDMDYCDVCANKYLDDLFHDEFTIREKAKIVSSTYNEIM